MQKGHPIHHSKFPRPKWEAVDCQCSPSIINSLFSLVQPWKLRPALPLSPDTGLRSLSCHHLKSLSIPALRSAWLEGRIASRLSGLLGRATLAFDLPHKTLDSCSCKHPLEACLPIEKLLHLCALFIQRLSLQSCCCRRLTLHVLPNPTQLN